MISGLAQRIGRLTLFFLREVGTHVLLLARAATAGGYLLRRRHLLIEQMHKIGVRSLPLVTIVSLFTGAVASWQAAYQFRGLISFDYLGAAVSAAILIELSPVLTGLVVAGRVGASIAAELGTMRVTEQIDALETLAIDPVHYLAAPRILAGFIMMPALVIYSNLVAHAGGYLVAYSMLDVSTAAFFGSARRYFLVHNVVAGLLKAFFFGGGTALIGCSIGFRTAGGAEGVGASTIRAFVYSSAFILVMDYILATLLF
ncbi:MAG TPA: ABC transporter permease [bacterium]|nr:ABC transporter permease [bacterium]